MSNELIITVFKDDHFNGEHRTIVDNEPNFENIGFGDVTSSIRIDQGPNYKNHVAIFYKDDNYRGASIGPYGPTELPDLKNESFGDCISSVRITQRS
jgi:hypothetical protein